MDIMTRISFPAMLSEVIAFEEVTQGNGSAVLRDYVQRVISGAVDPEEYRNAMKGATHENQ